ncbi:MAG: neutral/alkaline non-lysosomal ceramidase N-terminal domain-containing protein [Planctomycetales bacterium]|nr:neutral/alkaline non-lysosomal ceramidase N-terminal domain-containing protein [Planctomycetales bacterium]MBN8629002.1 neutral/alkaline non-lysosomal ceramidase N-terminal domain-containing protein [Planctomycetota bacterium]
MKTWLSLVLVLYGVGSAEAGWLGGAAEEKITPKEPMWMSGYGSRTAPADGKADDLYARALVLEGDEKSRVVLITLDLVGIDRATSQAICKKLEEKHGLKREQIAINCSHTHCGPVVGTNLGAMYEMSPAQWKQVERYTADLQKKVVDVVGEAIGKLQPVEVRWGQGRCNFAVNRRENKEADVPKMREEQQPLKGPSDHSVPVLAVYDAKGNLISVAFGYACHATTLGFQQWSADYCGFACLEMTRRHPGVVPLFWAGCGADQNPIPRRTYGLAETYGRRLAEAVHAVLRTRGEGETKVLSGKITPQYAEIDLKFANVPTKQEWEAQLSKGNKYEQGRAKQMLARLAAGETIADRYPYPVQTWQLGDGPLWVVLGGEVVVDYALRLKQSHGPDRTWVAGYSNDVMAYIPSRRVLAEGGYEGATSMTIYGLPSPWHPMLEEAIVEEVARQGK